MFVRGRSKLHYIWGIFCISVAFWGFGGYKIAITQDIVKVDIWWRITHIGVIFIPVLFTHFVYLFLKIKNKWLFISIYIAGIIFLAADFINGLFIANMRWVFNQFYYDSPPGPFYIPFTALFFGLVIFSHIKLWQGFRVASGIEKTQIKYFFIATFVGFIGGSLSFLPVYKIDLYPFLNLSVFLYPLIMGYAILKHRLMDIKVVLRLSTVYLTSVLTIFLPAIPILYYVDKFYSELTIAASLAILVLAVSVFAPIRNYYYRLANKYFFSSLYDSREVVASLSDKLRSTLELDKVYGFISDALLGAFHCKTVGILNSKQPDGRYELVFNSGLGAEEQKMFSGGKTLYDFFAKQSKGLVVEELRRAAYQENKTVLDLLVKVGVAVGVPLNVKNEVLGIIVLGPKESNDMYSDEDLRTLEVIASQSAIAIKNAQLYDETKKFSITLQREVERQTAELKRTNEELEKLDKAKSDFISIASHQLRTPLSAIKGFSSMMLEGSYGLITDILRDKLEKIYESAERLIRLVNDLLDLSHMEGGKMEFHFGKVDLTAMVQSVTEELAPTALKKKLVLDFVKPKKELFVRADEQKLRQVVMNLIDNAVKYTESGLVNVSLGEKDGWAQFSVKDTGIGMEQKEIANLFQKFMRGSEASHYHTEGAGVGLYVAKKLIEEHKGDVWAESEGEGKGSTFFVKLPKWE